MKSIDEHIELFYASESPGIASEQGLRDLIERVRREQVEELRPYLDHDPTCTYCNCGLDAILAQSTPAQEPPKPTRYRCERCGWQPSEGMGAEEGMRCFRQGSCTGTMRPIEEVDRG